MPTNLGTPMHVGNPGDRTTPLPATTWGPPKPKRPSIDWAAIQAAQPAPVIEPAPEKTVEAIRATVKKRRVPRPRVTRPANTCDCGATIARASTRCKTCFHAQLAPRRSVVDVDIARAEYLAGATCPEIATTHGWPVVSVRRQLRAAGVPMRDDRGRKSGGGNRAEYHRPELPGLVRSLYLDQGMSQRQAAEWLGVSFKVVVRIMRQEGITARQGQTGGADTLRGIHDRLTSLGVTSATIRRWARANGHEAPVRGVVPNHLIDAYEQATR